MKSIRSVAVRLGLASIAAAGATLLGGAAQADSTPSPSGKCETTLTCSGGNAQLRAQGRGPFATSVSTGWLPSCTTPDPKGHCSDESLQFRADISLTAPEDTSQMLYDVDMRKGAIVDVTWPEKDSLTLKLAGGTSTDGNLVIQHGLAPNVGIYVGKLLGINIDQEFNWDASVLITKIPGNHWNYLGTGTNHFLPWAFDPGADVNVKGPDLANATLFSIPLESLPGMNGLLAGTIGLSATTSPTFTYKTTKVQFAGVSNPITSTTPSAKIKTQNADSIDLFANVEGELSFKGTMEVLPVLIITQIYKLTGLHIEIPISVGAKTDYDSGTAPLPVVFPGVKIHVPLPNVFVPADDVDFGTIKTGTQEEKTITVNNTGELGAILSIESSDPSFVIPSPQAQMTSKATQNVVVRYSPVKDGANTATITVKSNDPDSPVQTFTVKGNAEPAAVAGGGPTSSGNDGNTEPPPAPTPQPASNSGCGCKTTGTNASSTAGTALLGLAALAFVRRRRSSKK